MLWCKTHQCANRIEPIAHGTGGTYCGHFSLGRGDAVCRTVDLGDTIAGELTRWIPQTTEYGEITPEAAQGIAAAVVAALEGKDE
jgi:hypothetical protein